mgnify:CR=1 FL=1
MNKKQKIKDVLDEFGNLAHSFQESHEIGAGGNEDETEAYWIGITFAKSYFEDFLSKTLKVKSTA